MATTTATTNVSKSARGTKTPTSTATQVANNNHPTAQHLQIQKTIVIIYYLIEK
jgi:hypothetical protein